jgi:hypothetical protein
MDEGLAGLVPVGGQEGPRHVDSAIAILCRDLFLAGDLGAWKKGAASRHGNDRHQDCRNDRASHAGHRARNWVLTLSNVRSYDESPFRTPVLPIQQAEEHETMALTKITPIPARVRWDRRHGRPTSVQMGDRQLMVRGLEAVRDETAAYPAERGPRITLLVDTDAGQASLVFDGRQRRWYVEALDQAA